MKIETLQTTRLFNIEERNDLPADGWKDFSQSLVFDDFIVQTMHDNIYYLFIEKTQI